MNIKTQSLLKCSVLYGSVLYAILILFYATALA